MSAEWHRISIISRRSYAFTSLMMLFFLRLGKMKKCNLFMQVLTTLSVLIIILETHKCNMLYIYINFAQKICNVEFCWIDFKLHHYVLFYIHFRF